MKVVAVLFSLMALAAAAPSHLVPGPALVRTPQFDSAVIKHDRLGGNFAYSTHEAHAYAAVNPVISHVATPVAVSYHAAPVVHAAPAVHAVHATPVVHAAPAVHAVHAAPVVHAAPYAAHAYPVAASPYAHW